MLEKQLFRAEKSRKHPASFVNTIKRNIARVDQMHEANLQQLLADFDPKRQIENTSVRFPEEHSQRPVSTRILEASSTIASWSLAAAETVHQWLSAGCWAKLLTCQWLGFILRMCCGLIQAIVMLLCCCRRKLLDAANVKTDSLVLIETEIKGKCTTEIRLKGPLDESDDEISSGGARWGEVGRLRVQFELLPKLLADERKCGEGRSLPNQFPCLPEPEREMLSLLNPMSSLVTLLGPDLVNSICGVLGLGCCLLLCVSTLPLMATQLVTSSVESAVGGE